MKGRRMAGVRGVIVDDNRRRLGEMDDNVEEKTMKKC
jgi:hypothetical protein